MANPLGNDDIRKMIEHGFDVFNVFTSDSTYTKDGKEFTSIAKTPCKRGEYDTMVAFKGWEKATHDELLESIALNAKGFGLRLGEQTNKCRIMSLDFDICGDKDSEGKRVGCSETLALWEKYKNGVDRQDGMFTSSTKTNFNVLIDYSNCQNIAKLIKKIGIAKIAKHHLEILLAKNQVIPPTATICKCDNKTGQPRKFFNEMPFYIMTDNDFVYAFVEELLTEYLKDKKTEKKQTKIETKKIDKKPEKKLTVDTIDKKEDEDIIQDDDDSGEEKEKEEDTGKWKSLLFDVIGTEKKLLPFHIWYQIFGVLNTNKFSKNVWLEWNSKIDLSKSKRRPSEFWDANAGKGGSFSFFVLQGIAKQINNEKYRSWLVEYGDDKTLTKMGYSDNDLAKIIAPLIRKTLVYCNESWIVFNSKSGLWGYVKRPTSHIADFVQKICETYIEAYTIKKHSAESKSLKALYDKSLTDADSLYRRFGEPHTVNNFMTLLNGKITDNDFSQNLDKNVYQIAYKNGILDLRNLEFRKGLRWDDFVTKHIPFDYEVATDEDIASVRAELKKICNYNESHLNYYLSFLGYSFTGDSSREQNIWCMKGQNASNGKSVVFEALSKIAPNYVTCLNSDIFEMGYGERHKEVATWGGVRLAWLNELRKGKKQDESYLKIVADGTAQKFKVMYGTMGVMPILWKLIFVGNHELKMDADEGVIRRYKHLQMDSDFQDDYVDDFNLRKFKKDKSFRTEKLEGKYKHALLALIFQYSKQYVDDKYCLKPYPNDWKTEGEIVMKNNNKFMTWFEENFEIGFEYGCFKWELDALLTESEKKEFADDLKRVQKKFSYDSRIAGGKIPKKIDGLGTKNYPKGKYFGFRLRQEMDEQNQQSTEEH
jgi:hypothetical protein